MTRGNQNEFEGERFGATEALGRGTIHVLGSENKLISSSQNAATQLQHSRGISGGDGCFGGWRLFGGDFRGRTCGTGTQRKLWKWWAWEFAAENGVATLLG